jgi:predicted amidophosphoribosyltransferase
MGPIGALLDLVWPQACGGCAAPATRWCAGCAAWLDQPARCARPTPSPPDLPATWAVAAYDGPVRAAVLAWKDHGRHDLTRPLARGLATSVLAALAAETPAAPGDRPGARTSRGASPIWLVPMPSRRAARRDRGGDLVRALAVRAAAAARVAGWPVRVVPAVGHRRAVADQSGLDAAERAANLSGAFVVPSRWRSQLGSARCLLVDDVMTTGATLAEAARSIAVAGGHPFGAAVLAATQRTHGGQVTNVKQEG